jgi:hypothetical protein
MGVGGAAFAGLLWRKAGRGKFSTGFKAVVPLISMLAMCGCAIHPVQQDVTRIKPTQLVNFIRCEARLAIQDKALLLLRDEKRPRSLALAEQLAAMRGQRWDFDPSRVLSSDELAFYNRYISTGIAFDFTFDITEDNGIGGSADPVKLITNGTVGIGLSASSDFKRQNSRHFVVSETFKDLLQNRKLDCEADYRPENHVYPIAGSIGLNELIATFVDLNELRSLASDKATSNVFADSLTFTTTVMGSASPHVIVSPMGHHVGLASPANLMASAQRVDKHALIIGLSMDVPKAGGNKAAVAAIVPGYSKSALQRSNVKSPAEQSALDAVTQARIDTYLDRVAH